MNEIKVLLFFIIPILASKLLFYSTYRFSIIEYNPSNTREVVMAAWWKTGILAAFCILVVGSLTRRIDQPIKPTIRDGFIIFFLILYVIAFLVFRPEVLFP